MKIKRVLVVYKISVLERVKNTQDVTRLQPDLKKKLFKSDLENRQTIHSVFYELVKRKINFDLISKDTSFPKRKYDLVIALGGDGTFFSVAHYAEKTPCILVNSDPQNSLGVFSACTRSDFAYTLDKIIKGQISRTLFSRLTIRIGGKKIKEMAVNDILFADRDPASITRYILTVDGKSESQESSGIWISTPAGSSAGIFSSGGKIVKINSKAMQFVVREPYTFRRKVKIVKGFAKIISIKPMGINSYCWIDGSRVVYHARPDQELKITITNRPLIVLGYNDKKRIVMSH